MSDKTNRKYIILFLNFFTGGLGTIISPFLLDEEYDCRKIIVAITIGIIQILHFFHILSLIFGFTFINNFYDIIGGENILMPFMSDKYKIFINNTQEIQDTLDDYFFESEIDPREILSKNSRITFLKIILVILSGLSYINSNLNPIIDLIYDKGVDFKMITYGIFNPGAGLFISSILYFNEENCRFVISIIGVLFGILLMACPYFLGIGIYLTKVLKSILNLFFIKFICMYFGALGTIYSLIYNFLQKDVNKDYDDDDEFENEMLDIKFYDWNIKSNFDVYTIIKVICNLLLPGSGVLSLMYRFGCHVGIFIIGIIQLGCGLMFWVVIMHLRDDTPQDSEEDELVMYGIFCFLLSILIAGVFIIFVSDYFKKKPIKYDGLGVLPMTGAFGNFITMYNKNNCFCENLFGNCIAIFFKIIWGFLGMYIQLYFTITIFKIP